MRRLEALKQAVARGYARVQSTSKLCACENVTLRAMHVHVRLYMYACISLCMCLHVQIHGFFRVCKNYPKRFASIQNVLLLPAHMYAQVRTTYVNMCVCVCVCVCVHMHVKIRLVSESALNVSDSLQKTL